MKILFLLPYPLKVAPSQRFRVEQYFGVLTAHGHTFDIQTFMDSNILSSPGQMVMKAFVIASGFGRRLKTLFTLSRYDFIFIHREVAPVGPPVFEWVMAKILGKKIIYDFDDAIWMVDNRKESGLITALRWRSKVISVCKWSYKVSCGNDWLAAYSLQANPQTIVNPTTIDTINLHNRNLYAAPEKHSIVIGWTGSHSTIKYLLPLEPVLKQLENKYPNLEFLVVSDAAPAMNLKSLKFRHWSTVSEITSLLLMDIGIMPLADDEWSKGKCGFKALQYMSLEIPAVVTPVGVNRQIIYNGKDGFFCSSEKEWIRILDQLINDVILRREIGTAGRVTVQQRYSVESNSSNFLSLFE